MAGCTDQLLQRNRSERPRLVSSVPLSPPAALWALPRGSAIAEDLLRPVSAMADVQELSQSTQALKI